MKRLKQEKNTETLRLRHEWKNQLLSLRMLQEKGDQEGLSARLRELDDELDHLTPRLYTDHLAVNTILQKAAAQADRQGIAFACQVQVPRELSVDEADLCTLLVNLLDNALEAAAQVQPPKRREVLCRIKLSQGFLAIHCENTYCGTVRLDQAGQLVTTKANAEGTASAWCRCGLWRRNTTACWISATTRTASPSRPRWRCRTEHGIWKNP